MNRSHWHTPSIKRKQSKKCTNSIWILIRLLSHCFPFLIERKLIKQMSYNRHACFGLTSNIRSHFIDFLNCLRVDRWRIVLVSPTTCSDPPMAWSYTWRCARVSLWRGVKQISCFRQNENGCYSSHKRRRIFWRPKPRLARPRAAWQQRTEKKLEPSKISMRV